MVHLSDHEFVIESSSNRRPREAYWLQERQAPTVWLRRPLAGPVSLPVGDFRMNARSAITAATLACSLAAALATSANAGPAAAQPGADKCYGVAMAGKNDCAAGAGTSCAGTSTIDYDPGHWKYVAKGSCEGMTTPKGHGSLTAM